MKKIIFIDRDGVINKDPGGWTEHSYVTRREDFIFLKGAKEGILALSRAGYEIVVISNQAGVAKGHYSEKELKEINDNMLNEISRFGGRIKKVYYCIHQPSDNCDCRKPKTGLFERAERELGIKPRSSYFIGDGKTDIEAGKRARLKTILVLSGKSNSRDIASWEIKPDHIFPGLLEAAEFIIKSAWTINAPNRDSLDE